MHVIGQNVDLTYPYNYLGEGAADLGAALKDKKWMKSFKEAKFPVVLVGPGILQRPDRDTILQQARNCARFCARFLQECMQGLVPVLMQGTPTLLAVSQSAVLSAFARAASGLYLLLATGCVANSCVLFVSSRSVSSTSMLQWYSTAKCAMAAPLPWHTKIKRLAPGVDL